jgi:hypothetical protein
MRNSWGIFSKNCLQKVKLKGFSACKKLLKCDCYVVGKSIATKEVKIGLISIFYEPLKKAWQTSSLCLKIGQMTVALVCRFAHIF